MTQQPSWTMPVCSRTGDRPRPFLWFSSTTHGVGIGQDTFSVEVLVLKPNQNCYHHGSHQSHVGPSLRSSRARSPQGRTEPVKVLGAPQRPDAFETLKIHRRFYLSQICHLRVASRRPDPNQDCCRHGSHESPVHPSLRRSRGMLALKVAQNLSRFWAASSAQRLLKP